jgi:superfamily II DNA or RNA helicase
VEDNLDKNICIIVPTKSLLAQTRKRLIENIRIRESQNKIVTHPDMLNDSSGKFIAVLTQERLLRLLQKHTDINFDILLIDEAHNLIENNNREILTIQNLKI